VIPRTLTAGGGDPLPHQYPDRPLAGRGAQAPPPGVETQTLVPLNFSAVVAHLLTYILKKSLSFGLRLNLLAFKTHWKTLE